jgi:hypothetical protein
LGVNTSITRNLIEQNRHERTAGMPVVMDRGRAVALATASFVSPVSQSSSIPGQIPGGQGTESPEYYKDSIANPDPFEANSSVSKKVKKCPGWMIVGQCVNGHRYAKELHCGKEWCQVCGQDGSIAHKRRIARLMPKLQQVTSLGYFVIEFPDDYRKVPYRTYSKKGIRSSTNRVVGVLAGARYHGKRQGGYFARGLLRWHWFGDKLQGKWNPHINVIIDAGYIPDAKLDIIKAKLKQALTCPDLIVNYSYTDQVPKKVHILKYVTRATFKDESWNEKMAVQLFGFRNIRWWGDWNQPAVWTNSDELPAISALESGHCPECGEPLSWGKPVDILWLQIERVANPLGDGYYELDSS